MGVSDGSQGYPDNFLSASKTLLDVINEGNNKEMIPIAKSWLKEVNNKIDKPLINLSSKYLAAILYLHNTENISSEQVLHASYLFLNALNVYNDYYLQNT